MEYLEAIDAGFEEELRLRADNQLVRLPYAIAAGDCEIRELARGEDTDNVSQCQSADPTYQAAHFSRPFMSEGLVFLSAGVACSTTGASVSTGANEPNNMMYVGGSE